MRPNPEHDQPPGEYQDALLNGATKGRGAGLNPGNRFEDVRLHVLGEHLDEIVAENPDGTRVVTQVYRDKSKTVLNHVDSPDVGFEWSVNPYRGCEHGCIYCYARPGHEMLGWSCGLDFETKIVAKHDAAALLRPALLHKKWMGQTIVMSGVTDPYQPIEAKLRITRSCLEIMAELRQPVGLITKSRLILRDIDLLSELARHNAARVSVSLTTLDKKVAMKMEPRASSPTDKLAAISGLAKAGVPVNVMTAPIVPGLTEHELPALLKAAAEAGATSAGYVLLRLPYQVKALFMDWLAREFPEKAAKVEHGIRETRHGALYNTEWFERQKGKGVRAEQLARTFKMFTRRYGLDQPHEPLSNEAFLEKKREREGQMTLFG